MLKSSMIFLGFSYGYHDSSVALFKDGKLLAAAHEERFTRIKFDKSFPIESLKWLNNEFIKKQFPNEKVLVSYYEDPDRKRERQIWTIRENASMKTVRHLFQALETNKKRIRNEISKNLEKLNIKFSQEVFFSDHHLSHLLPSYYFSNVQSALGLVADAVGEWDTTSIWNCKDGLVTKTDSQTFPNSLGILYSMITYFCGFKVNSGEYKLMGLAPYGKPDFLKQIENIAPLDQRGFPIFHEDILSYLKKDSFELSALDELFGFRRRLPSEEILQRHANLAASIQVHLENSLTKIINFYNKDCGFDSIVMGGGVALNCVANAKIVNSFQNIKNFFVFPAAGDAGGSVGAAIAHMMNEFGPNILFKNSENRKEFSPYIGRKSSHEEVEKLISNFNLSSAELNLKEIAGELADGKIVGWFSGRSEFGPRALGNRSIFANPTIKKGQITLNEKIKFRESFRPFAPIVTDSGFEKLFEGILGTEHMLKTVKVKSFNSTKSDFQSDEKITISERLNSYSSVVPSVTHLDGSARVQTLKENANPVVYGLLKEFGKISGYECLINTSFNVRGEPIVDTALDALRCFATTGIDILVLENRVIKKANLGSHQIMNFFDSAVGDD
jgi:carbamoyltransferase